MDVVATTINALIVAAVGLGLAWHSKGRFDALDHRIDRLEERVDRLEERSDRRLEGIQTALDGLRSDLTQVALAVGVPSRPSNA
jgi:hypothetical protein